MSQFDDNNRKQIKVGKVEMWKTAILHLVDRIE